MCLNRVLLCFFLYFCRIVAFQCGVMPCYRGGYFYDEDDIQQDITFSLSHVRVGDNDVAGFLPS